MNKICTTIEQSKKLIELGIDVNTADMCYPPYYMSDENSLYYAKKAENFTVAELSQNRSNKDEYIPAWSLTALFDLLPEHTRIPSRLKQNKYMFNYHNGIVEFGDDCHKDKSTNLFDAVFEMVVWLKENGKI